MGNLWRLKITEVTLAAVRYSAVKTFNVAICVDTSWHTHRSASHTPTFPQCFVVCGKTKFKDFLKTAISLQMLKISNNFEVSTLVIKDKV